MVVSAKFSFLNVMSGRNQESNKAWARFTLLDVNNVVWTLFAPSASALLLADKAKSYAVGDEITVYLSITPNFDGKSYRVTIEDI